MAIQNHQELTTAVEKITQLQLALEEMKTTEAAGDFQRQAEGMMALITGIRREIDAYLSLGEEIADDVRGEPVAATMVGDQHPAAIGMLVDALVALAFHVLKALVFKGSDDAAGRNVAQERQGWTLGSHTVTAATGSLIT